MSHNSEHDIDYESLPVGAGWGTHMLAGAMAGISEHTVIYPVDAIKTRMQVLPSLNPSSLLAHASASGSTTAAAASSTLPHPTTLLSHLRHASATQSMRSLWKGVTSVVMGAGPAHAIQFGTYEFAKEVLGGDAATVVGVGATALAGAAATTASDAFMNPFDVVKQRMQLSNSTFRSPLDCAKHLYRNEGIAAFYVSYPTTLLMNIPLAAFNFSLYETLKNMLNPTGEYSPGTHILAGAMSGGTAAAITTPLDVAKTLLQTRGTSSDPRIRNATNVTQALRIIVQRDGLKGLRRGMSARVVTFAPSTAISWLSYEFFKSLIKSQDYASSAMQ